MKGLANCQRMDGCRRSSALEASSDESKIRTWRIERISRKKERIHSPNPHHPPHSLFICRHRGAQRRPQMNERRKEALPFFHPPNPPDPRYRCPERICVSKGSVPQKDRCPERIGVPEGSVPRED